VGKRVSACGGVSIVTRTTAPDRGAA